MEPKKIFSKLGLGLFIMTIVLTAVQFALFALAAVIPSLMQTSWFSLFTVFFSFHVIGFLVFYLFTKGIPAPSKGEPKNMPVKHFLILYVISMSATYLFNILSTALTSLISLLKQSQVINPLEGVVSSQNIIIQILILVISAPIVEEFIFRKIMLDRLRPFGDKTAIWVTALAFGLFHGNLFQAFYATILGMILAYAAIRTNRIRYSIFLHVAINFTGSILMPYLVLSGITALQVIGSLLVYGLMIGGVVLFFICKKKIHLEAASIPIEKPVRFQTIYLNVGMILYFLVCLFMFIANTMV